MAFPLISAKIFRGNRDLAGLLELSLDALVTAAWTRLVLKEVVLVAFSSRESDALLAAAWRAKTLQKRPRTAYAPRARQTPKKQRPSTSTSRATPRRGARRLGPRSRCDLTGRPGRPDDRGRPVAQAQGARRALSLDLTIDDDDDAAPRTAKKPRTKDATPRRRSTREALELVVDLTEPRDGEHDDDDDVPDHRAAEGPREAAPAPAQSVQGPERRPARTLNEIMRDHERRKSGVIDVDDDDDDAALAQALQAREDTFESDRELARKLQAELNGPARMAPSKRKAAPDTSATQRARGASPRRTARERPLRGSARRSRRIARRRRRGAGRRRVRSLDVLADQRKSIQDLAREEREGLNVTACDANPHSMPGKPLYNRFVESWQRVLRPDETVFHGEGARTERERDLRGPRPEAPLGPGIRSGRVLRRRRQRGHLGWLLQGPRRKMLLVAVLVDKSGLTLDNGSIIRQQTGVPTAALRLTFAAGATLPRRPPAPMRAGYQAPSVRLNGVAVGQAYQNASGGSETSRRNCRRRDRLVSSDVGAETAAQQNGGFFGDFGEPMDGRRTLRAASSSV